MKDAEPRKERMIRYSFQTQVAQMDHVEKNGRLILQWIPARLTSAKTNGDHGLMRTQSRGASSTLKVNNFRKEKKNVDGHDYGFRSDCCENFHVLNW